MQKALPYCENDWKLIWISQRGYGISIIELSKYQLDMAQEKPGQDDLALNRGIELDNLYRSLWISTAL